MYAIADLSHTFDAEARQDPIDSELAEIEDLRRRTMANRDILYCSPAARHLVEKEIPRLIGIIRQLRQMDVPGNELPSSDRWAHGLLLELRQEVSILRDLMDRK